MTIARVFQNSQCINIVLFWPCAIKQSDFTKGMALMEANKSCLPLLVCINFIPKVFDSYCDGHVADIEILGQVGHGGGGTLFDAGL